MVDTALEVVEPEGSLIIWHGSTRLHAGDRIDEAEVKVVPIRAGARLALLTDIPHVVSNVQQAMRSSRI